MGQKEGTFVQKQKNTSYYIATLTIGTESNRGAERESNQGHTYDHMSYHQLYYILYTRPLA